MTETLTPFYMWAGGKSRLMQRYQAVWPDIAQFDSYVEPFFGGGAVMCWVDSVRPDLVCVGNDVNEELVGLLGAVADDVEEFLRSVTRLVRVYLKVDGNANRKVWYYQQRKLYWKNPTPARLYVLMRLGFNGIWQTCADSKGLFGTPAGLLKHTTIEQVVDKPLIRAWAAKLAHVTMHAGSYEDTPIPSGTALIYLDPPYRDSFTTYGTVFNDTEQKRLAEWYREQVENGHTVILSNRCVEGDTFFEDLIGDIADLHYFDVTYTAGRRKKTEDGFEAKPARELLAISR